MDDFIKTDGINLFWGEKGATALLIATSLGDIQGLGDLGGLTGGEKMDVTNKNQVLTPGGGEDVVKRSAPKKIAMAPLSFTLRPGAAMAGYAAIAAIAQIVKGFKITFPDKLVTTATSIHGDGFITECKLAGGGDDMLVNVTIEPTGDKWTITPAA